MAHLVGTPAPSRATPEALLNVVARWNECLLTKKILRCLQIKPATIGSPWLVCKITQNQSTQSRAAQDAFGYVPRPLEEILKRNYRWLVEVGSLPARL